MQLCTLWGDLSADRISDQYPLANVCEECIKQQLNSEDSPIVNLSGSYDSSFGTECALCDKDISEEQLDVE